KWYFGKKALSVDYRDDYARLLNANLGAPAGINFGADEIGGEGLTVTPTRTVALWSGVVDTGVDGKAVVKLPAALFNGELRLMAVAWTDKAVGSTSKPMTVREAVVADLNLPRFMAPGDRATATLELHNLEGKAGQYQASVTASGGLFAQVRRMVSLAIGQRTTEKIDVEGPSRAGIGEVQMAVTGPQFSTSKTYPLQTRLGWGPQTIAYTEQQAAGATYTPPNELLVGLQPGSVTMYVSYSPFRGFDPAAVAMALEGYRFGCTEQVVSTAYPLLYADRLGQRPGPTSSPGLDNAIQTLLSRQSLDGAFGLWSAGDRLADPWLGAYTTDFLLEAKTRGAQVPQDAIDRAMSAMRKIAKPDGYAAVSYKLEYGRYWLGNEEASRKATLLLRSRASAYALYVLAKGGQGDLARLRWWHDVQMKDDPEPLPRAQIAAALALMGDHARARSALNAAVQTIGYREYADWYQSPLRDTAGVITYAYEAGETTMARALQAKLEGSVRAPDELNTQEQARLLQAAAAMLKDAGPNRVKAHGSGAIILPAVAGQSRWGVSLLS
ncbi:MAG: alpha-2-macroglobulin family protein, partial [Alphaproteobacteria bacterium]